MLMQEVIWAWCWQGGMWWGELAQQKIILMTSALFDTHWTRKIWHLKTTSMKHIFDTHWTHKIIFKNYLDEAHVWHFLTKSNFCLSQKYNFQLSNLLCLVQSVGWRSDIKVSWAANWELWAENKCSSELFSTVNQAHFWRVSCYDNGWRIISAERRP